MRRSHGGNGRRPRLRHDREPVREEWRRCEAYRAEIDVEGAEWDSLLSTPDEVLQRIDQMAVEFHWELENSRWIQQERYPRLVRRLKQFFEIAHIHFNNASCLDGLDPFPTWAYEVLFVSKRLAVIDPSGRRVAFTRSTRRTIRRSRTASRSLGEVKRGLPGERLAVRAG